MDALKCNMLLILLVLQMACGAGQRMYYLEAELPKLENQPELVVAPGPWKMNRVGKVVSNADVVPDELVLSTLKALMALPGAADACDSNTQRPRRDASEYCVALYKTPIDWRASSPIRSYVEEQSSCQPPFGGVDDQDFGRNLPIFGFAHNHPCGTGASSPDMDVFPRTSIKEGKWYVVTYSATPNGRIARDPKGNPIPAWDWLATGHIDSPRFYRWNEEGRVFKWNENGGHWEYMATCKSQYSNMLTTKPLPPRCDPALEW